MKRIHYSVISLLLSGLFLTQCKNVAENDDFSILNSASSGPAKITGYIHNRNVYPLTTEIIINVSHISGKERVTEIKTPVEKDGTFEFVIDLARPQDVTMLPYIDYLYLIPGDSLHIEIDFKNFSNVQLSGGKSAKINQEFFKYFDATSYRATQISYTGVNAECEMNCSWDEIMRKYNTERNNFRKRRQGFLTYNKVYNEVIFLTEAMIELDYYDALVRTINRREQFLGKKTMDKEEMMKELNEVANKYFNAGLYSNSHFKFITSYITAASLASRPGKDTDFVDWIYEVAKSDTIRDFIFAVKAANALLQKDMDEFEKYSVHINHDYLLDRLLCQGDGGIDIMSIPPSP